MFLGVKVQISHLIKCGDITCDKKRGLVGLFSVEFHNSNYMKAAHEKDVQTKKKKKIYSLKGP